MGSIFDFLTLSGRGIGEKTVVRVVDGERRIKNHTDQEG
jgi:hypothetical protein